MFLVAAALAQFAQGQDEQIGRLIGLLTDVEAYFGIEESGVQVPVARDTDEEIPLMVSGSGKCSSTDPCGQCEGDCDDDSDCGFGLKCFLRNQNWDVPGCKSGGAGDVQHYDYCYIAEATCATTPFNCAGEAVNTVNKGAGVSCSGDAATCDAATCCGPEQTSVMSGTQAPPTGICLKDHGREGCTSTDKCYPCEGDCDTDSDCQDGLMCFKRNHFQPVPGCTDCGDGGDVQHHDYCIPQAAPETPDKSEVLPGSPPPAGPTLTPPTDPEKELIVTGSVKCSSTDPCEECEGDCDDDIDCEPGLKCFLRNQNRAVPGCKSGGAGDIQHFDYCYKPTQPETGGGTAVLPATQAPPTETCLTDFGRSGCTSTDQCSACEGDCDTDSDCTGGLKCFKRNNKTPVPGCMDCDDGGNVQHADYCYDAGLTPPSSRSVQSADFGISALNRLNHARAILHELEMMEDVQALDELEMNEDRDDWF